MTTLINFIFLDVSFFRAVFEYDFILYAVIAGIIVGILAPLIGSVVVIRRLSFIADTLSHFSLAGVCLGVILSKVIHINAVSPVVMGVVFSIIGTFLIERLRALYENYKEISMPIIMSLGLALSGLLINVSSDINSKFTQSLLYGSIYSVNLTDLIVIIISFILIILFCVFFYKKVITLCFDETYARVSGINTRLISLLLTIVLSLIISLYIDIIGVLLIASLMILPIASAILIGDSFVNSIIISIAFSEASIFSGFIISYHLDLSTGPVVIIINLLIYVSIIIYRAIKKHILNKNASN